MLLEWSCYPSEELHEQTRYLSQAIGEQHFTGARSTMLFYSQKLSSILRLEHASHKARISKSSHLTKLAVSQHRCSGITLLLCLMNMRLHTLPLTCSYVTIVPQKAVTRIDIYGLIF